MNHTDLPTLVACTHLYGSVVYVHVSYPSDGMFFYNYNKSVTRTNIIYPKLLKEKVFMTPFSKKKMHNCRAPGFILRNTNVRKVGKLKIILKIEDIFWKFWEILVICKKILTKMQEEKINIISRKSTKNSMKSWGKFEKVLRKIFKNCGT